MGELDRDYTVKPGVARLPHFAHTAFAEHRNDLVGTDLVACGESHRGLLILPPGSPQSPGLTGNSEKAPPDPQARYSKGFPFGTRPEMRQLTSAYMADKTDVYTFDPDHAIIAYPLSILRDVAGAFLPSSAQLSETEDAHLRATCKDAIKYGCHAVILDTLSFQAPGFYEKRGYSRIGVVDGYRGGSQKIFMQKHLDGSFPPDSRTNTEVNR
jgi:hypothetical protein